MAKDGYFMSDLMGNWFAFLLGLIIFLWSCTDLKVLKKYHWKCYAGGILIASHKLLLYRLWKDWNYCKKHNVYWNKLKEFPPRPPFRKINKIFYRSLSTKHLKNFKKIIWSLSHKILREFKRTNWTNNIRSWLNNTHASTAAATI